jgi:hypothetical protein
MPIIGEEPIGHHVFEVDEQRKLVLQDARGIGHASSGVTVPSVSTVRLSLS